VGEKERGAAIVLLPHRTAPAPIHLLARLGMPDVPEEGTGRTDGEPLARGRLRAVPDAPHPKLNKPGSSNNRKVGSRK
jgi:hypothetical protein